MIDSARHRQEFEAWNSKADRVGTPHVTLDETLRQQRSDLLQRGRALIEGFHEELQREREAAATRRASDIVGPGAMMDYGDESQKEPMLQAYNRARDLLGSFEVNDGLTQAMETICGRLQRGEHVDMNFGPYADTNVINAFETAVRTLYREMCGGEVRIDGMARDGDGVLHLTLTKNEEATSPP